MSTIYARLKKTVISDDNKAHTEIEDLGEHPSGSTIYYNPNKIFADKRVKSACIMTSQYTSGNVSVKLSSYRG